MCGLQDRRVHTELAIKDSVHTGGVIEGQMPNGWYLYSVPRYVLEREIRPQQTVLQWRKTR